MKLLCKETKIFLVGTDSFDRHGFDDLTGLPFQRLAEIHGRGRDIYSPFPAFLVDSNPHDLVGYYVSPVGLLVGAVPETRPVGQQRRLSMHREPDGGVSEVQFGRKRMHRKESTRLSSWALRCSRRSVYLVKA